MVLLFPRSEEIRKLWLKSIPKEINLTSTSVLCSKHFETTCFAKQYNRKGNLLRVDAVPTLFYDASIIHDTQPSTSQASSTLIAAEVMCSNESKINESATGSSTESVEEIEIGEIQPLPSSSTITATSLSATLTGSESCSSNVISSPRKETIPIQIRKRRRLCYFGDIHTSDFSSPTKAKRNWTLIKEREAATRRKLNLLSVRNRRLKSKINSLEDLIIDLKSTNLITDNAHSILMATLPQPASELIERILKGSKKQKYSPELRKFALTLNFYSKKAYEYVRQQFNNCLPHNSTITKWYRRIDGSPGFTNEVIKVLKVKAEEASNSNKTILCNLVMDEMSIRKQFTGLVDMGTDFDSDDVPHAKEVLVFMIVAVNDFWKLPVGYFFLNGLSASERANLVLKCLEFLNEVNIKIIGLTFDGAPANISMTNHLGANINVNNLKPYFPHPASNHKIYIIPDACHMLKLVRNCLATKRDIIHDESCISWKYFEKLNDLQESEGLHLGNKLKRRNIHSWKKEIMKVKLATQVFSLSVANSLEYLSQDLKLIEFEGSEETVNFIKVINNLFDILNSRNLLASYKYKRPIQMDNHKDIFKYLDYSKEYILNLKTNDNIPIINSNRKMGFIGFLIAIESLKNLFQEYVVDSKLLKFIPTYKLSQVHLEIYFSAVRSRGGFNNNPTAKQFEYIYKRLLIHNQIGGSNNANCVAQDETLILSVPSTSLTQCQAGDETLYEELHLPDFESHDYCKSEAWHLTTYAEDVVAYIAGFVVKKLTNVIKCNICRNLILGETALSKLQIRKEWGNLTCAAKFVVKLCMETEKRIKFYKINNKLFNRKNLKDIIINSVSYDYDYTEINHLMGDHLYNLENTDSHVNQITKLIIKTYLNIRFHHETKLSLEIDIKERIRSNLTKLIIHKNQ